MLIMGAAPLLHRSFSQQLNSQVLPFAALQAFKNAVPALSHALLVVQIFENAFVVTGPTVKTIPVVAQRSLAAPQSFSVWLLLQASLLLLIKAVWCHCTNGDITGWGYRFGMNLLIYRRYLTIIHTTFNGSSGQAPRPDLFTFFEIRKSKITLHTEEKKALSNFTYSSLQLTNCQPRRKL